MTQRFIAPTGPDGIAETSEMAALRVRSVQVRGPNPDAVSKNTQTSVVFNLQDLTPRVPTAPDSAEVINENSAKAVLAALNKYLLKYSSDKAAEAFGVRQETHLVPVDGDSFGRISTAQREQLLDLVKRLLPADLNEDMGAEKRQLIENLVDAVMEYFIECGDVSKTMTAMLYAVEPIRYNNGSPNKVSELRGLNFADSVEEGAPSFTDVVTRRTAAIRFTVSRAKTAKAEKAKSQTVTAEMERLKAAFLAQSASLGDLLEEETATANDSAEVSAAQEIVKIAERLRLQNFVQAKRIVQLCAKLLDNGTSGEYSAKLNAKLSTQKGEVSSKMRFQIINGADLLSASMDAAPEVLKNRFDIVLGLFTE